MRSGVALARRVERENMAANRRAERAATRHRRELLTQLAYAERMHEQQRATYDVALYDSYVDSLVSVHRECWNPWDWRMVHATPPPPAPAYSSHNEHAAVAAMHGYQPSIADKLLGKDKQNREALASAAAQARVHDQTAYQHAMVAHGQAVQRWQWFHDVSAAVLSQDLRAYLAVVEHLSPFSELTDLGTAVAVRVLAPWCVEATVDVKDDAIVPDEEHSLSSSGRVLTKKISTGRYWEIYQDYVCGAALRVGRELLALLPITMVLVHAKVRMLDSSTGHHVQQPVLSVALYRDVMARLNFDTVDASDSLKNFVHNMDFKKTKGFASVEMLEPEQFTPAGQVPQPTRTRSRTRA